MRQIRITHLLFGLLCFDTALPANAEEPAAQQAASDVLVVPVDGAIVRGRLMSLDENTVSIQDNSGESHSWSTRQLKAVETAGATAMQEAAPLILLSNDDVLTGTVERADEDTLSIVWTATTPPRLVSVPLESVRSFVFQQPQDDIEQIRFRRLWALHDSPADRLISADDPIVDGEFVGLSEGEVRLNSALGDFVAPVKDVSAVLMNSELISTPEVTGSYVLLSFPDGSRLTLRTASLTEDGLLQGTTVWGSGVDFPVSSVTRLQFLGDRVVPLSDLVPQEYKFIPYLTQEYPLVANRNVHGGPLRLRGKIFPTGLGVSSRSEVAYDLEKDDYTTFEATIGVDDMTEGQGNVVFAVEIDGNRVFDSGPLGGRAAPKAVGPLDVSQGHQLKLIVDYGEFGNIQDVANWCDPVLIRAETKPSEGG